MLRCRRLSSSLRRLVVTPCRFRKLLSSVLPTPPAVKGGMGGEHERERAGEGMGVDGRTGGWGGN